MLVLSDSLKAVTQRTNFQNNLLDACPVSYEFQKNRVEHVQCITNNEFEIEQLKFSFVLVSNCNFTDNRRGIFLRGLALI